MAGTNPNFDPDLFRDGIRQAMRLSEANEPEKRVTFRWKPVKTFAKKSPGGSPYDFTAAPEASDEHPDLVVPVAVEFSARTSFGRETSLGRFDSSHITLTLLDEEYHKVFGGSRPPDICVVGGDEYDILSHHPTIGLFDVDVFQVLLQSVDES